ncbi:glutaredoxin family protein [Pseudomonas sp. dw_358]|uniref:glutaredoxin family protein n=1 Tax=Pseudomonas sp. dw_358 TaxID=2720083 RepID=UPI001BD6C9F1|nr:glutaredoxin family protein [Pseudomonas sp. dw_358]
MRAECQLFIIPACPQCELAEYELMPLIEQGLLVELIDISVDQYLRDRYASATPLLRRVDTGAELAWPFEADQVVAFLGSTEGR